MVGGAVYVCCAFATLKWWYKFKSLLQLWSSQNKEATKPTILPFVPFCVWGWFMGSVNWELGADRGNPDCCSVPPITVSCSYCPDHLETPASGENTLLSEREAKSSTASAPPNEGKHTERCDQSYVILAAAAVSHYTDKDIRHSDSILPHLDKQSFLPDHSQSCISHPNNLEAKPLENV